MKELDNILKAREDRFAMRKEIAEKGDFSLSLTLNIPGYPKSNENLSEFFSIVLSELKRYLVANRISLNQESFRVDEAGGFFLSAIDFNESKVEKVKEICEAFEEKHVLGRLLDVDITDKDNKPVSSGKVKNCILCKDNPAIQCMREQTHDQTELREYIFERVDKYIQEKKRRDICSKLATFAVRSVLYEISLTPKPGLVDKNNSGSHADMNYTLFINSTAEISGFFNELTRNGYDYCEEDYLKALPIIRRTGLKMEEKMFASTNQVNTQKGLIFLMGIAIFSAANVIACHERFDIESFRDVVKKINKNILSELKKTDNTSLTHGEYCAEKYGLKAASGARGEAYNGFPLIFDFGLKELLKYSFEDVVFNEISHNESLTNSLVAIISQNDDTNIMYRGGLDVLQHVKELAKSILEEKPGKERSIKYKQLIDYCLEKKVSPGGSADLLAVTVFIYLVFQKYQK